MTPARRRPASAPAPAEAFVLAGGASSRMGRDKALLPVDGVPLIERALEILRALPLAAPPRIAGASAGVSGDLAGYAPVIRDLHPGCGPLSGMEAALTASSQPLNLFLAVDLPLIPTGFLAWMLARAALTEALVTCPRILGRAQPLCAVYHRDLLPRIGSALSAGNYKVAAVLGPCWVDAQIDDHGSRQESDQVDAFDMERVTAASPELQDFSPVPWREWFRNLNSPDDVKQLSRLRKRLSGSPAPSPATAV